MIKTKALLFAVAAATRLSVVVGAADPYPQPQGYVTDAAGVLDARASSALANLLSELDKKADAQVAVVMVKDLGGRDIESYAVGLYEAWGIGKKGTDRGALILVSVGDRKARIETGYGLEAILPDGLCGEILDQDMIPFFKQGGYSEGILRGAGRVASVVAKDAGVELSGVRIPASRSSGNGGLSLVLFLLLLFFLAPVFLRNPLLVLLLLNSGRRRGGFGGGGFGGGFGGFGGGSSGGGGASRGW
jgi:uncharacterized protein